ncbi:MAG: hypothetical protein H6574_22685 [Lewinellaceae bacterium]|nr:hypothetical protein [Saprospiraceae bacterium]MCB9333872.1 hypothetical protein [Lewinellaceae bacterium]
MHEILLILHFIGLAMGLGTSFGFMFLGIASAKLEKSEALKFSRHALALSTMGQIGLVLLPASGILLMSDYWATLSDNYPLILKLILFLVLATLVLIITSLGKKIRSDADAEIYLPKIAALGRVTLLTGLVIVILAVYIFH